MDIFKDKGSRTQGGTKYVTNPQQDERGRTNTERPFFLSVRPIGKKKTQRQTKKENKERQPEQRRTKGQKQEQREKTKGIDREKAKNGGKHATSL